MDRSSKGKSPLDKYWEQSDLDRTITRGSKMESTEDFSLKDPLYFEWSTRNKPTTTIKDCTARVEPSRAHVGTMMNGSTQSGDFAYLAGNQDALLFSLRFIHGRSMKGINVVRKGGWNERVGKI